MVYNLPAEGETAWASKLNGSIDTVKATADAAETPAGSQAKADAAKAFAIARANHTGTQSADTIVDGTTNKAYATTEQTKLAGIATGATVNSPDATLLARGNHTGTQSADTLTDGTTNKAFLATERTKLSGIATGATANSTDATLKARANHTGTQTLSTISDAGTAAAANTGTTSGTVPLLGTGGVLAAARIGSGTPAAGQYVDGGTGAWTTLPAGGGVTYPPLMSGGFHFNAAVGGTWNSAFGVTSGTLYALPFFVDGTTTFNGWATTIGTPQASALMRCGIYAVNSVGNPGSLILDAGTIDCSTGGDKTLTISQSLSPGAYLVVAVTNNSSLQIRAIGAGPVPNHRIWFNQAPGPIQNTARYMTFTGYTTAALPSTATTTGRAIVDSGDFPGFFLKAA